MSGSKVQSADVDIDIGRLVGAIWRDKFRILIGALIFTGLMFFVLSGISPQYSASTRVLINDSETIFTRPTREREQAVTETRIDREFVESQVQILTSTDLLMRVAIQEKLSEDGEFNPTEGMSSLKRGLAEVGVITDPRRVGVEQRLLTKIRDRLKVYPIENSRVIVIEFTSENPQIASRVPLALAELYLSTESLEQRENTGQAADYLSNEITELQTSVRDAEEKVADFRAAYGLFSTGTQDDNTLATQQLTQLSTELSRVRAERSSVQSRVRSVEAALKSGAALDTLPDVIASQLIERLNERKVQLDGQIAELSTTLLPGHPRIQSLRSQASALDNQIRAQAGKVLQSLRNQAQINQARENELEADLNRLKAASSQEGSREVELRALEREAASQRALLESYLVRFREAQSRGDAEFAPATARIISTDPVPAEPVFPKILPLLVASFVGSILLLCLVSLVRELFSGRAMVPAGQMVPAVQPGGENAQASAQQQPAPHLYASSAHEPSAHAPQPSHVQMQYAQLSDRQIAARQRFANMEAAGGPGTSSMLGGAARQNNGLQGFSPSSVASQLMQRTVRRAIVVSPEGDAGSICSVRLVRQFADEGLSAVLVDLTGRSASSQHMLSDFSKLGITDLLASQANYTDIIHADAATQADIIPTGNGDMQTAMRSIERLPMILNALSSAYDVVVLDCGSTDAESLSRLSTDDCEVILAMVEPNSQAVRAASEQLAGYGYGRVLIMSNVMGDHNTERRHDTQMA